MNIDRVILLYTHVAGPHSFVPNKDVALVLVEEGNPVYFISTINFVVEEEEAYLVFELVGKDDAIWIKRDTFDSVAHIDVYTKVDK